MANRRDVYVEMGEVQSNHVSHFAMRTMNPARLAEFYRDVFELQPRNKAEGDENHYLTDGHVTLVVMPWRIADYDGTGITSACLDHIGFTVESVDAFNAHLERIVSINPSLAPATFSAGPEGQARLELAQRSCPLCQRHLADVDGVLLSVSEA